MNDYRKQALLEYNSEQTAAHLGGVNGRPFWNLNSSQFMFVPAFQFPRVPNAKAYLFSAEDKDGKVHTFTSEKPTASLAPVWGDIPPGIVCLRVESLDKDGKRLNLIGARTFYKLTPFPGRDAFPPKARSYRECGLAALRFAYNDSIVQHWLINGTPKPDFPHNAYPAKTFSSVIRFMVNYAKYDPSKKEEALFIARRAADYMLSITPEGDHPLAGLTPTYCLKGLDEKIVQQIAPAAIRCKGTTMMIYPVMAANAYLMLGDATGEEKYTNAAMRIAEYYKKNVLPSGSWYLQLDEATGKPLAENVCVSFNFVNFFHTLYEKTADECWRALEVGHYKFLSEVCLKNYRWEGQFEDVDVSGNYINLTHFHADNLIGYIADNLKDDEKMVEEATDLMRYVEDQFVVWGEHPKWNLGYKEEIRLYPAGLEQYFCYDPIDSSTATIMNAFLNMYKLKGERLYLEKAMTLGDMITRMQYPESGVIPTFWLGENACYGIENFWINCMIGTATTMIRLADLTESEGIE